MAHRSLWASVQNSGADVALLQEAAPPPADLGIAVMPGGDRPWRTSGWETRGWRTAIAHLNDEIQLEPVDFLPVDEAGETSHAVSREGTITAARVVGHGAKPFIVASIYACWERRPHIATPIWADASAHRILSDLAALAYDEHNTPLIVAGDWNILKGYGEGGDEYWGRRYQSVFDRAESMRLEFAGPDKSNGRQAEPWPEELPKDSTCVPTYRSTRQTPETATRQLDFVFASKSIRSRVSVEALNQPDEWRDSDHCQIIIKVDA